MSHSYNNTLLNFYPLFIFPLQCFLISDNWFQGLVYISEPLLSGFTCASAVHVFTSQLNGLFGIRLNRATGPFRVFYVSLKIYDRFHLTYLGL
ncbi:unnamed protein product [Schistosoma margrebowiei]|uniref:SLC26A/SulP transporter domain-containing protein n=1 Tax=Schistosoma margrebowiei TaxID=48269 RepID=A0A3P8ADN1_9TREM|nr:unnamed protein product [Schistosoma margrebowiei]